MKKLQKNVSALGSLAVMMAMSGAALSQECSSQLDEMEQALDQSELTGEELEPMRQELSGARQAADGGDEEGCSAAAAKLLSAMLQTDGIDSEGLCGRTQSEDDIGEAGMEGNQDVQSALQTSCNEAEAQ